MDEENKRPWVPKKEYWDELWIIANDVVRKCSKEPDRTKVVSIDIDSLYRLATASRGLMFLWNDIVREVKLPHLMKEYIEGALGFKADPNIKGFGYPQDDDDDIEGEEWKKV